MATRSYIGIKNDDSTIQCIYCHFDGDTNGKTLLNHYTDENKIRELIALGDISYLCEMIKPDDGIQHSFKNPANGVTVAYHRDRNEKLSIKSILNEDEYYNIPVPYKYLWKDGKWFVNNKELKNSL